MNIFDYTPYDKYFKQAITLTTGKFNFVVLRPIKVVNQDTRTTKNTLVILDSGVTSWDVPTERLDYKIDGKIYTTEGMFYIDSNKQVAQGDIIYRFDKQRYYDVLGVRDYTSHYEVDSCLLSRGYNQAVVGLSPPIPAQNGYINHELAVFV